MSDFYEICAANLDGTGMVVVRGDSGGPGLRGLWISRKENGKFCEEILPWRESEAKALKSAPRLQIIQRGDATDFVDPDPSNPNAHFLVNKQVIEALDTAKIKGWVARAVKFEVINGRNVVLREEVFFTLIPLGEPPACSVENWQRTEPAHGSEPRRQVETFIRCADQSEAFRNAGRGGISVRQIPRVESWDGNDFMFGGSGFDGSFWCSRKVVELAHREQWTNAAFQPVDMFMRNLTDFRLRCWPPEKWYPRWHPGYRPDLHKGETEEMSNSPLNVERLPVCWATVMKIGPPGAYAFVKKHAVVLGEAHMEETADLGARCNTFDEICSYLVLLPPGPAEDGLLLMAMDRAWVAERTDWFPKLTPAQKSKITSFIEDPPDALFQGLTMSNSISPVENRRDMAKFFGLKLDIKEREDFDD